jgi:DNA-binding NarL/FixJ family response regulator
MGVRVFIVDDHEIFRAGLRMVIESMSDACFAAEASSVREACTLLDKVDFDLLVVDLAMRGLSGMSLVRELRRRGKRQPILVLTMHGDADLAAEALAAGATGFALKSDSRESLVEAVKRVSRGERFIAASLPLATIESFLNARPRSTDTTGPLAALSPREREVFDLLVRGYTNVAIASELCVSLKTVDTHRTHVFGKLHVHSLGELLLFGFRHRLVDTGVVDPRAADQPLVPPPPRLVD